MAAMIIKISPKIASGLWPIHISHPRIVSSPTMPVNSPINCFVASFSPRYFTAKRLLHIGIEYRSTEDFPASTKRRLNMTSKNTAAVCSKPTMIKCFQYLFGGNPNFKNNTMMSNVSAPTLNLKAVNVNGPIYVSDAFICTHAYPQRTVIKIMSSHNAHLCVWKIEVRKEFLRIIEWTSIQNLHSTEIVSYYGKKKRGLLHEKKTGHPVFCVWNFRDVQWNFRNRAQVFNNAP